MKNHMLRHPENENGVVEYDPRFDEYSVAIPGLESGGQCIYFCPWCGVKLPPSARDQWFDELETMGLDPLEDEIPVEYQNGTWRERRGPSAE